MCDFISIAVPEAARDAVGKWRRRGFALAEHSNPHLRQALPRGYTPYVLTTGHCSCDLCRKHPRATSTADAVALRDDASAIVRELAPSFLYVHFYSGDIATEQLPITERVRRSLDSLGSAGEPLLRDTLIELVTQNRAKKA
jgi:hypothetical protein